MALIAKPLGKKKDEVKPGKKWKFDGSVTKAFDDMLSRSIPQYEVMRRACFDIGRRHVTPETWVVDLGCSRGEALAPFVEAFPESKFLGIEVSTPMRQAARERFAGKENVDIMGFDLRGERFSIPNASLILSVLTLQFTSRVSAVATLLKGISAMVSLGMRMTMGASYLATVSVCAAAVIESRRQREVMICFIEWLLFSTNVVVPDISS